MLHFATDFSILLKIAFLLGALKMLPKGPCNIRAKNLVSVKTNDKITMLHLHKKIKWAKACYQGKRGYTEFIYPLKLLSSSNRLALSIWPSGKSSDICRDEMAYFGP